MRKTILMAAFALLCAAVSLAQRVKTTANYRVIPLPRQIQMLKTPGFTLNAQTRIVYPKGNEALKKDAQMLSDYLFDMTRIRLVTTSNRAAKNVIVLATGLQNDNKEAYRLRVNKDKIEINGATAAGTFYGIQTLRKSVSTVRAQQVVFPAAVITDNPRFAYRGAMLDVARHFFNTDEVKNFIDILALHNINRFHWHLTDDQGWRIEIKKYPRLTEVSAFRPETVIDNDAGTFDGKPHGGFYTQQQARDIVKYAADRNIMVVPEIDMPGHMVGALAAYPELGCTGGPYKVRNYWGIAEEVLCAGNDKTLQFAKDVLAEVMDVFPGDYINIGGDECIKKNWEKCPKCQAKIKEMNLKADGRHTAEQRLQSYFMSAVADFITSKGRKVAGWDEILEGGIAPNATVLSWRGMEGGIEAAQALILPRFTKSEAEKAKLIGAKLGDTISLEPFALYGGEAPEIASLLNIEKEAVPALDGVGFSYQIHKISRREPAELNDAFFTEAFGEGSDIRSEEALRKNIQESFAEQFATESDFKFTRDLRALLLKKAGKVAYDEALLKRIFLARNAEAKVEDLDRDMPQILDDITFDRIKGQLLEAAGVQISDEDVNKFALIVAKNQFAMYGMTSVPDELLENYAQSMLKDERTKENLIDRVADSKLAAIAKEAITVTEKEVSPEDFNKLMSEDTKA